MSRWSAFLPRRVPRARGSRIRRTILRHVRLSVVERDRVRIRAHLERVERLLRERDTTALTEAQRAARERSLDVLRAYRERGEFPRNTDFPGRRVPCFIDRGGRVCAVAQLVIESGHGEVARAVARAANNAYLAEMRIPALEAWIATSGFLFRELALIQPEYCGGCDLGTDLVACTTGECVPNEPTSTDNHCVYTTKENGAGCIDSLEEEGVCRDGACVSQSVYCDDGDPGTEDTYDADAGCLHEPPVEPHSGCSASAGAPGGGVALVLLLGAAGVRAALRVGRRRHARRRGPAAAAEAAAHAGLVAAAADFRQARRPWSSKPSLRRRSAPGVTGSGNSPPT